MAVARKVGETIQAQLANATGKNATPQAFYTSDIVSPFSQEYGQQEDLLHPIFHTPTVTFSNSDIFTYINGIFSCSVEGATLTGCELYAEEYRYSNGSIVLSGNKVLIGTYSPNTSNSINVVNHGRSCFWYRAVATNIYGTFRSGYSPVNIYHSVLVHRQSSETGVTMRAKVGYTHGYETNTPLYITHSVSNQYRGIKHTTAIDEASVTYVAQTPRRCETVSRTSYWEASLYCEIPIELTTTDTSYLHVLHARSENDLAEHLIHTSQSTHTSDLLPVYNVAPNRTRDSGTYTYKGKTQFPFLTIPGTFAFFGQDKSSDKVYLYCSTNLDLSNEANVNALKFTLQDAESYPRFIIRKDSGSLSVCYYRTTTEVLHPTFTTVNGWYKIDFSDIISEFNVLSHIYYVSSTGTETVTNLYPTYAMREVCPAYGIKVNVGVPFTDIDGYVCTNSFTNEISDDKKPEDIKRTKRRKKD